MTPNVPGLVAAVVPAYASLQELGTVYGVQDAHDMLEMTVVAAHNRHEADKRARKGAQR